MGNNILGIDVGSISLSLAAVDEQGRILQFVSRTHAGEVHKTLKDCLQILELPDDAQVVVTSSTPATIHAKHRVDNLVAAIRAAGRLHPGLRALLLVGGERFSLSFFGADGVYRESRFNSLCAAGTGSFLDQQARRLGLVDSAALAECAMQSRGDRPQIATRCAVFAKTDLIHAQQGGYPLEAICDGLCYGLAANVHDALFSGRSAPRPIVFAGGVALNRAVVKHMSEISDRQLIVDEYASIYGAYGAVLDLIETGRLGQKDARTGSSSRLENVIGQERSKNKTYYPPLELSLSSYPEFVSLESYEYQPCHVKAVGSVEVDIYQPLESGQCLDVFLGLDIGSTSTKAVFLGTADDSPAKANEGVAVLAGFYTRTAGRPLLAIQAVFEAASNWAERSDLTLDVRGTGTTGSGRKFIGALIGADLVIDEISAHAQAAVCLDPSVDTIIEIGGQDAKFTTLSGGIVTQAIMNHVCAAGTGSFIEEQAQRLGCSLADFANRTVGQRAPLASDRCTVFMERDINHFLTDGYDLDEVLCSVLHSVRDNYLLKVAREGNIGERICFQGATAKNRSLVAAFEQKLQKPIQVSRYCHLTGALGVALELRTQSERGQLAQTSRFRGLDLYREQIPIRSEICELCKNHCKLRLAEVRGETVGYGYLCGRDQEEEKFVPANRSGFDLLKARARHFHFEAHTPRRAVRIGLPAALYMAEEMPFWKKFFDELGVATVTSRGLSDSVSQGKRLAGAEFCAPMSAWHAHVASLQDRADYIFTPFYLEAEHPKDVRRHYCYYTQYAPALISSMHKNGLAEICLMPLMHIGERQFASWSELHKSLVGALGHDLKKAEVVKAYKRAREFYDQRMADWPRVMKEQTTEPEDLAVVLLGRPYTIFMPEMNKSIPDILSKQGIKAFYQDMLDIQDLGEVDDLVHEVEWLYSQKMLAAAETVARTPGLYPLLITSFKCAPDSCTIEYFRRVMNAHGKPYLILQLDEHDSQVGYETRIEAAVRSFRNHLLGARPIGDRRCLPRVPVHIHKVSGRSLLVPAWDTLASPLFVAGMQNAGIDAHLIYEDDVLIQQSLGLNTGQCVPLAIIVEEFVESVKRLDLDPADCALWMPNASMGCNICFFPQYAKGLLESIGKGFEHSAVYAGETTGIEISAKGAFNSYFAYLFGGMLRRMQCKIRPYEVKAGETDRVVNKSLEIFRKAILGQRPKLKATQEVVERFLAIEVEGEPRHQVAIFGDLYTRDNDIMNQDLIRVIEAHGGEVITTPYTEYARIIGRSYLRKWLREGLYKEVLVAAPFLFGGDLLERSYQKEFVKVLGTRPVVNPQGSVEEILARFNMRMHHTGESFDNLLKIFHLLERYPDLALFVQANPAFCCPALVTEAQAGQIERQTGVPIVTVTYDGTAAPKNDVVVPYLELAQKQSKRQDPKTEAATSK
ncbi:MAG: CoA activase [Deltaproteobacteria bacterium]|nr:CoA activase [Deltaproteobacteria bacterium]